MALMFDPEHRKILKQGVKVFNEWRKENADIKPKLIRADLVGMDLGGADLVGASLREVNLSGANLSRANLSRADLIWADLSGTDLNEANLSWANLRWVNFSWANLYKTNFHQAIIAYTIFGDTDLSNVLGFENTRQTGPSIIGIDTIFRSGGKISHKFLENAGVPDNFIEYMGSLTGQAFQFYSCFISYSNNDKEFADRINADLRKEGVRCWFAPEDMKIGDKIRDRIDHSIRIHDKLLLVLSEHSINSEWVEDEVESAYEQEKNRGSTVLFPIRLDDAVMDTEKAWAAKLRRSRHIGDFTNWKDHDSYQEAFKRLLRDLQAEDH